MFQPFKRAPRDSIPRVQPREYVEESGIPIPLNDSFTTGHLWKNELPPKELEIMTARNGIVDCDVSKDDLICEALIFGTTEDDLSKVTAIGVDALLRGLEVCFSNGESRTIGHTNAMQYVSIGGPGGERILYFTSKMSYYPSSFQFVTNKGRTFVAAEPSAESHVMFPE